MVGVTTERSEIEQAEAVAPIPPLAFTFELECSAEHAFRTWTERIDAWWPAGHTVSGEHDVRVVLEPRLGGRLLERTASGIEHEWGEITAWEPPARFAYLWYIRRDRADATDVEITFTPLGPGRARVDILHTAWERLGADGQGWRDRNTGGWNGVLPSFIALAERNDHD
jgi:hypothetical protein